MFCLHVPLYDAVMNKILNIERETCKSEKLIKH